MTKIVHFVQLGASECQQQNCTQLKNDLFNLYS